MAQNQPKSHQPNAQAPTADRAAIYVRVSSTGQLGRDGDEDGYSIPAQVKACEAEAVSKGAEVAKVYVERAESAKSDDRPVLQLMLRELPKLGVKYLIVHKVDRLARNRLDDAMLYQRLVKMGVKLVSASENIDETPAGQLMHGMLATFAEYYSNNLASEIMKGLRRKHEQGGTPHKPPIGYLSKRELIGGQDIRSVIVDEQRAPLVKEAFSLYATGDWSLHKLAAHLEQAGLRSRGTRRYPERPLSASRIHAMLHNPYYMGVVVWNKERYPGKHEPLVDQDTFDRVQLLLAAARVGGERPQKHEHYLRGSIFCDECMGRLLYGRHRGRSGRYYEYFCCNNRTVRRRGQCASGHFPVDLTEEHIIEQVYASVFIPPETQEQIRQELRHELAERTGVIEREAERHERTLAQIEAKQEKLVQLYYQDLVSEQVFAAEQDKLKTERHAAKRLRSIATAQLDDIQEALDLALSRVDCPQEIYKDATPVERRVMNLAIFERIEVGPDAEITGTTLTPVYKALTAWQPGLGQPKPRQKANDANGGRRPGDFRLLFAPVHLRPPVRSRGAGAVEARVRRQCATAGASRDGVAARGWEGVSCAPLGCIQDGSAPVGGILTAWSSSMSSSSCSSRRTKAAITSTRPISPDCTRRARTSRKRPTTPARRLACTSRVCAKKVARLVRVSCGAGSPFPRERASAGRLRRTAHLGVGTARLGSRASTRQPCAAAPSGSGHGAGRSATQGTEARDAGRHPQRRGC
jgi:site-specific DNA recombinase